MKMSALAVEQMMDSYEDRVIGLYNEAGKGHIWEFPMKLAQEAKKIHEELCWMEEGGWLTSEEAQSLWSHVEKACARFQEYWEIDMVVDD